VQLTPHSLDPNGQEDEEVYDGQEREWCVDVGKLSEGCHSEDGKEMLLCYIVAKSRHSA
jgi:hypothetical protein